MKIADEISKNIHEYPNLFKKVDYETSKLEVLNHLFFTIGNGYEFAYTENPNEGGYLIEPKYKGDIRVFDKPYGVLKYKELPNNYFKYGEPLFNIKFSPSELCDYSKAAHFYNGEFLQDDWVVELNFLCQKTLDYFNDESQYNENYFFPNDHKIAQDLRYFQYTFKTDGIKGLNDLQKTWGYEIKDKTPSFEEIENKYKTSWQKFHKTQIKLLTKILTKI